MSSLRVCSSLFLLLAAGLFACSKGEITAESTNQKQSTVRYAGKLKISIIPEAPTASEDLQVIYSGSGSPTFRWEKNGQVIDGERGQRLARKWFVRGDDITAVVFANGEEGKVSLKVANAPPEVTSVTVSPENICRGVDITAVPAASDADGDQIGFSYTWVVNDQALPEDTPVLKGDKFKRGDRISVRVIPSDGQSAGRGYATQAFTVPAAIPRFVSTPPLTFNGTTYVYDVKANDPDGDTLSYALLSAPPGMTINSNTGRLEWQVKGSTGSYLIEIEAKNSQGLSTTQKYTLNVTIP